MKAKIICMASAKGGSGKTVLTATFGQFLASIGKKVLLVDTDASTNGLTLLYLKEVMTKNEIYISKKIKPFGVYQNNQSNYLKITPSIVELQSGVDLIPATYEFQNTESVKVDAYFESLLSIKKNYSEKYDYIFLDAQAGSDVYAEIAMGRRISDEVVIVSEYDPLSAAGIERLKGLFREELTYDRTWILLNKMLPEFVKSFSDFMEVARYLNPIPWSASVVKSYARRRLALDMENVNSYTYAVSNVLRTLLGEEIEDTIREWASKNETKLLEPIHARYDRIKKELDSLYLAKDKEVYKRNRKRKFLLFVIVYSLAGLIALSFFLINGNSIIITNAMKDFSKSTGTLKVALTMIITTIIGILAGLVPNLYEKTNNRDLRMENRENSLTKQLEVMETLKKADIESLIRESSSVSEINRYTRE